MTDIDQAATAVVQALLDLGAQHEADPGAGYAGFDAFTRAVRALPAEDRSALVAAAAMAAPQLGQIAAECFDFDDAAGAVAHPEPE